MIPNPTYAATQNVIRRKLWPHIDTIKEEFGGYGRYPLPDNEYALTTQQTVREAREMMIELGYRPEPVAAIKDGPYGDFELGSWVSRESWGAPKQDHVHFFAEGPDEPLVFFAHREWSWIPTPSDPRRPWRHYDPPDGYPEPIPNEFILQVERGGFTYTFDDGFLSD